MMTHESGYSIIHVSHPCFTVQGVKASQLFILPLCSIENTVTQLLYVLIKLAWRQIELEGKKIKWEMRNGTLQDSRSERGQKMGLVVGKKQKQHKRRRNMCESHVLPGRFVYILKTIFVQNLRKLSAWLTLCGLYVFVQVAKWCSG